MSDTKIIEDRRVQEVRITLADGRSGVFTGPELAREEDDGFGVVEIMFYPARPADARRDVQAAAESARLLESGTEV